jgi:hypothetical protein
MKMLTEFWLEHDDEHWDTVIALIRRAVDCPKLRDGPPSARFRRILAKLVDHLEAEGRRNKTAAKTEKKTGKKKKKRVWPDPDVRTMPPLVWLGIVSILQKLRMTEDGMTEDEEYAFGEWTTGLQSNISLQDGNGVLLALALSRQEIDYEGTMQTLECSLGITPVQPTLQEAAQSGHVLVVTTKDPVSHRETVELFVKLSDAMQFAEAQMNAGKMVWMRAERREEGKCVFYTLVWPPRR